MDGADTIPTVTDVREVPSSEDVDHEDISLLLQNLAEQGLIDAAIVGFSVPPSTDPETEGASLEFGAPDGKKFTGELNYVPITKTSPSSRYWGIDQSIRSVTPFSYQI